MATYFSILAWEIPWTEEPGGLQPTALQKSWTQLSNQTRTHTGGSEVRPHLRTLFRFILHLVSWLPDPQQPGPPCRSQVILR